MNYYTYAFLREDGTPYYIGKGSGQRWTWKYGRIIKAPKDTSRIIKLKENLTEEQAFAHERYMIAVLPNLHNLTEGGDGVSGYKHTEETKKKMRAAKVGRKMSEETKAKIRAALKGKKKPTRTEEHKQNISKAMAGKKRGPYKKKS